LGSQGVGAEGITIIITTGARGGFAGRGVCMNHYLTIGPVVSLLAGIFILVMPRLLSYITAIYLIIVGLLGLLGDRNFHLK
jgi:hypothetical protein